MIVMLSCQINWDYLKFSLPESFSQGEILLTLNQIYLVFWFFFSPQAVHVSSLPY